MADLRATDNDVEKLVEAAMGENRPALLAKYIVELREELYEHEDNWIDQDCIPQYLDENEYIVESHLEENNQVAIDEDELTQLKDENEKLKMEVGLKVGAFTRVQEENEKLKDRLFSSSEEGNGKVAILQEKYDTVVKHKLCREEQLTKIGNILGYDYANIDNNKLLIDKVKEIKTYNENLKEQNFQLEMFHEWDKVAVLKLMEANQDIEKLKEEIKKLRENL